jgi:endogenous inhibitor of DNA gyrase (YacG/DUF329 family)
VTTSLLRQFHRGTGGHAGQGRTRRRATPDRFDIQPLGTYLQSMTKADKPCPICRKPAAEKYQPFCSSRCAMIDLGKWLGESYRVETEDPHEDPAPEET